MGYSVLNTICSMLSSFVEIYGIKVGKHPGICPYMEGNMNPTLLKHNFPWDVRAVVKYLTNASSEKHDLSKKLATLTAILCGQRPKEILGLIDIHNLSFENFLVIDIGDIMKASNKKFRIGEIKKMIKFVSSHV